MRILLIGNFSVPYEEENLHNLTLLNQTVREGIDSLAINIGELPDDHAIGIPANKKIINAKNYLDFIIKLIRYGIKSNVIHFLTKGYTRPGLMKLMTTVIIGKFMLKKIIITLHPEMFSVFGQLRSKMGGQQLLHLSFSMADRVICGDASTREVASSYCKIKDKFELIASFIYVPEDLKENEISFFKKLENKKRILVFSGIKYPSVMFDILIDLLTKYLQPDMGIVVSISEKKSKQLEHVIEESGSRIINNILFISDTEERLLAMAYARADHMIRPLSCDGKPLFDKIAFVLKKPQLSGHYMYFPISLLFIKEGEIADLCAYVINMILAEKSEKLPPHEENLYKKILDIYLK